MLPNMIALHIATTGHTRRLVLNRAQLVDCVAVRDLDVLELSCGDFRADVFCTPYEVANKSANQHNSFSQVMLHKVDPERSIINTLYGALFLVAYDSAGQWKDTTVDDLQTFIKCFGYVHHMSPSLTLSPLVTGSGSSAAASSLTCPTPA